MAAVTSTSITTPTLDLTSNLHDIMNSPDTYSTPLLSHSPDSSSPSSIEAVCTPSPSSQNATDATYTITALTASTNSSTISMSPYSGTLREQVIRRRPSRLKRKPVPRLTLEEELALLDDESKHGANSGATRTPFPGFGLLPALELLARQVDAAAGTNKTITAAATSSHEVDRREITHMQDLVIKQALPPVVMATVSKATACKALEERHQITNTEAASCTSAPHTVTTTPVISVKVDEQPQSPIRPDAPSVSAAAIEWYTTPDSKDLPAAQDSSKRFRIPTDVAEDCAGAPPRNYVSSASCRTSVTSMAASSFHNSDMGESRECYGSEQEAGEEDTDNEDDKRASIMTTAFGTSGLKMSHNSLDTCKTGACGNQLAPFDSDEEDEEHNSEDSRDYVSALPTPRARNETWDYLSQSVRLSEYRWISALPTSTLSGKVGNFKSSWKQRMESNSTTTTTRRYPRSRSPTYDSNTASTPTDQDHLSFVTAADHSMPVSPSIGSNTSGEASDDVFKTPTIAHAAQMGRPFVSTSPSDKSFDELSMCSAAATATTSESSSNDSIFDDQGNIRDLQQQRGSTYSTKSDPVGMFGGSAEGDSTIRYIIPGRKISLNIETSRYAPATTRWDEQGVSTTINGTATKTVIRPPRPPVVRRPHTADSVPFIHDFGSPPLDYQKPPPVPKSRGINMPSLIRREASSSTMSTRATAGGDTAHSTGRKRAFSLVMRELLHFHEARIKARHEAALIKAEKKAAAKRALTAYSYTRPDKDQMAVAADCTVYTSTGKEIRFGDLYEGARTIVCFIRHYWCPSCQDYMASIMRVEPEQLRALNLQLVIIGCGSWKMIDGYRKALGGCNFPIYSDPSRQVYKSLGITRYTLEAGARPDYTKRGLTANTMISMKRNMSMPLKNPGDLTGLGGEFVFGPGRSDCAYAHRMKTSRDHAELVDILKAIGTTVPKELQVPLSFPKLVKKVVAPEAQIVRRPRSAGEIKQDAARSKAESIRRKRSKAFKAGRVVVRVVDNPLLKEESVEIAVERVGRF